MEISKLRSDQVGANTQQQKVSDSKATGKSDVLKSIEGQDSLQKQSGVAGKNSSENVKWSAEADLIAEGVQAAKESPDVRADRVAELKAAIRGGTYKTDAKAIAEKMIQSSFEEGLLTRKS